MRKENGEEKKKSKQKTMLKVLGVFPPPGTGANPEPFLRAAADIVYQAFLEYEQKTQERG